MAGDEPDKIIDDAIDDGVEAIELVVYSVEVNYLDKTKTFECTDVEFHGNSVVFLLPAKLGTSAEMTMGGPSKYPHLKNYPTEIFSEYIIENITSEPVRTVTLHPDDTGDGEFIDI